MANFPISKVKKWALILLLLFLICFAFWYMNDNSLTGMWNGYYDKDSLTVVIIECNNQKLIGEGYFIKKGKETNKIIPFHISGDYSIKYIDLSFSISEKTINNIILERVSNNDMKGFGYFNKDTLYSITLIRN